MTIDRIRRTEIINRTEMNFKRLGGLSELINGFHHVDRQETNRNTQVVVMETRGIEHEERDDESLC